MMRMSQTTLSSISATLTWPVMPVKTVSSRPPLGRSPHTRLRGTWLPSTCHLSICGDNRRVAHTDVCLLDQRSTMILLILQDKTVFSASQPEPQVIASAIAAIAYQNNNDKAQITFPP
ncbi:hypothetical protein BD769DRAFT_366933 [Suillus cothurnatus]|nr:hypothetical protein BD769DRAFT_366933 [Suillus cothurnatus]